MKRIIIFLLLTSTLNGFSQIDQKAKSILDEVSQRTKAFNSITSDFQFTMENAEVGLKEANKGNLIIQDKAFKLSISGIEIFCNGETQWTFMKDANEVSISDVSESEENMINPATIFTIYEQGFRNTYLGEFTSDARKTYKIEMIPDEVKEFTRVILEIDQSNYQIVGAVMNGTDANKYTIKITNMNTSKKYSDSEFTFETKKHPNVEVIDMR
ncbi:MAG: outer membrane lipoprotein carrier protein LolA [Prolixibacteraceae bacterium]